MPVMKKLAATVDETEVAEVIEYTPRDKQFYALAVLMVSSALLTNGYAGGDHDMPKAVETAEAVSRFLDGGVIPEEYVLVKHSVTLARLQALNVEIGQPGAIQPGQITAREMTNKTKALKDFYPKGIPKKETVEKENTAALKSLCDLSEGVRYAALQSTCMRLSSSKEITGGSTEGALDVVTEETLRAREIFAKLKLPFVSTKTLAKDDGNSLSADMIKDGVPYPASYGLEATIALLAPIVEQVESLQKIVQDAQSESAKAAEQAPETKPEPKESP
jgi:hypothetical protein